MKKILFVTDRNVLTTSGELRLMKNRAESLYREYGIVTDFIVLSKKERIVKRSEYISAGGNTFAYEMSVIHPLISLSSHKKIVREIKSRLANSDYGAVILSGFGMPFYAKVVKKSFDIPILLDIHGASEDMLELAQISPKAKGMMFSVLYQVDKKIIKNSLSHVDGFLVVTEALKEYMKARYAVNDDYHFFTIPCATDGKVFNYVEYLRDRVKYRKKYFIKEDEVVFIYSGGISPWQCVRETIDLYKNVADRLEKKSRMLIFSHNKEAIESLIAGDDRIKIDSYSPEELEHALHAGDYAFLLRKNNTTNNVAFPNKYLEYVQSGMKIITTPYVHEIAKQVMENQLGFIYDFGMDIDLLLTYIRNSNLEENREDCINRTLRVNSFKNTTKSFFEWYEMNT